MAIESGISVGSDSPAQPRLAHTEGSLEACAFELSLEQHHTGVEYFRAGRDAGGIALAQHAMRLFTCGHGFLGGLNRRQAGLNLIEALLNLHGHTRVELRQTMIEGPSLRFGHRAVRFGA